jgi:hypothetical protein
MKTIKPFDNKIRKKLKEFVSIFKKTLKYLRMLRLELMESDSRHHNFFSKYS